MKKILLLVVAAVVLAACGNKPKHKMKQDMQDKMPNIHNI